jgi:hypothetical protein
MVLLWACRLFLVWLEETRESGVHCSLAQQMSVGMKTLNSFHHHSALDFLKQRSMQTVKIDICGSDF